MRVELDIALRPERTDRVPAPVAESVSAAVRQHQLKEERWLRRIALARVIEDAITAGEFEDLADVARRCGISRALVSHLCARCAQFKDSRTPDSMAE